MRYVFGIDLGTSYFKLAIFDRRARLCGLARVAMPKSIPAPGRCELDPAHFWDLLRDGIARALHEARATAEDLAAVSYASQANSFLILDEADKPLTPLILWPDRRAEQVDPKFSQLWDRPDFLSTTGLGLRSPEFMAAKLCWLQRHAPTTWRRTKRIMTISDYLACGATGVAAGDEGTAAMLGWWDVPRRCWWPEALALLEIPAAYLSAPKAPGEIIGPVSSSGAARLGLPRGIPFVAGSLDHHMAAVGVGLGTLADAVDSTGTVLVLLRATRDFQPLPGGCTGPAAFGQGFHQMAFSNEGAAALEHYQRDHAPDTRLDTLLEMAAADPADGHGAKVRALLQSSARALEGLRRLLYPDGAPACITATGGGARHDLALQLKADLLGADFVVTACPEPACLGAALFAAIAAGWYADLEEASTVCIAEKNRFTPQSQPTPPRV